MPVPQVSELNAARAVMLERKNTWAANALNDMALKLVKYGKYASDKQQAFFAKLVAEASAPVAPKPAQEAIPMPRIFAALRIGGGKFAKLELEELTISCKADNSLAWIIDNASGSAFGRLAVLDNGIATFWKPSVLTGLRHVLEAFEADPIVVASAFGRATGRCCCCGRTLTNPDSIAAGIGPICAGGF